MPKQRWITVGVCLGICLLLVALILPAIQQAREAARRSTSKNNLKQIGLALHNYHDTHLCFPPGGVIREEGTAMHGWLTMLLPFFDASPDYYGVNFDEPWESPANLPVFEQALPKFLVPGREKQYTSSGYGVTYYLGNPHLLYRNSSVRVNQMKQGTAHAWMAGEVAGNYQPWSYPFNWRPLGTKMCSGPNSYGQFPWRGGHLLLADGSISFFSVDTSPAILKQLAAAPPVPTREQMAVPQKRFKSVAVGLQWKWVSLQSDPESRASYYVKILDNQKQQPLKIHLFLVTEPTEEQGKINNLVLKGYPRPYFLVSIDSETDIVQALEETSMAQETTPALFAANVKTLQALQKRLPEKDSTR